MQRKRIRILQIASLTWIWIFVFSVDLWILSLLRVARHLNDALNASVAIGIVAMPLFLLHNDKGRRQGRCRYSGIQGK